MAKRAIGLAFFAFSFMVSQDIVQVKLKNGSSVKGEFIGTYMDHVHLLVGESIVYYKCEDINYITKSHILAFDYNCSKNTVTPEILFPPKINPMTGEWETTVPDLFNSEKGKVAKKTTSNQNDLVVKPMESLKNSFKEAQQKIENSVDAIKHNTKPFLEPEAKPQPGLEERNRVSVETSLDGSTSPLTEDEIRKLIKKEVRKEIRKVLPYEIRKHKEERQSKLFQNVLLGCGAWFFFMMMLG